MWQMQNALICFYLFTYWSDFCVPLSSETKSTPLISGRDKRTSRQRSDHPLLCPSLPQQPLPPVELLQRRGPLPHPHLWHPVRAQRLLAALGQPRGAGRLQGSVWRRLSATDGPQALGAHGQLHLCVLHAIQHSHGAHWRHNRGSCRWGYKHKHSQSPKRPVCKLVHWSNRSRQIQPRISPSLNTFKLPVSGSGSIIPYIFHGGTT